MKVSIVLCLLLVALLSCVHDTQGARSLRSTKVGNFFKKAGNSIKKEAVKVDQGIKKEANVVNEKVLKPIDQEIKKDAEVVNDKVLKPVKNKVVDLWGKAKEEALDYWRKAKCAAVEYAGKKLFEEAGPETEEECDKLANKAAELCEELGGGPEDPLADACVALVESPAVKNECVKLITDGLEFTYEKFKADDSKKLASALRENVKARKPLTKYEKSTTNQAGGLKPYDGWSMDTLSDGWFFPKGVVSVDSENVFRFYLSQLPPSTKGGVHIHTSKKCGHGVDAGPHWFQGQEDDMNDFWKNTPIEWESDAMGNANGEFMLNDYNASFPYDMNKGHSIIIHAPNGTKVACGVLKPKKN